jgi:4-amino-4-deoxy-L-arabinose transferase-like glycosyltransferase
VYTTRQIDIIFLLAFLAIGIFKFLILVYTPYDLAADEAYYWDWSRRLDYSYYSKGPLVAWLIATSTSIFGDTAFAIRFPAWLSAKAFSLVYYLFIRKIYTPRLALVSWLGMQSMLFFATLGLAHTTDPATMLLWLLALCFSVIAINKQNTSYWGLVGLSAGIAFLSKATSIILLPAISMFLFFTQSLRFNIRTKGFLYACILFFWCLLPIVFWNYMHDWVHFQHNVEHLSKGTSGAVTYRYILELIFGQMGLVGPVFFVIIIYAYVLSWGRWRRGDVISGLYCFTGAPLIAICFYVSLTKRVYANWPMPIYIGGLLLVTHLVHEGVLSSKRWKGIIKKGFFINAVVLIIAYLPIMGITLGVPGKYLPTKKVVGWEALGMIASEQYNKIAKGFSWEEDFDDLFILAGSYDVAASLAFYMKGQPRVYCMESQAKRMNQYSIWGGLEEMNGKNALIVMKENEPPEELIRSFNNIQALPDEHTVYHSGSKIRTFKFFYGDNYTH